MNDEQIKKWQKQLDRLNLQLKLGQMEAKKLFIEEQKKLREWAQTLDFKVDKLGDSLAEKEKEFKDIIAKLEVQIAEADQEAKNELEQNGGTHIKLKDEQHEKLNQVIEEMEKTLAEISKSSEDKLNEFKLRFDLFEIQLKRKKEENDAAWKLRKNEIEGKLGELENKLQSASQNGEKALSKLKDDIVLSWDNLTDTINNAKKES